MPIIRWRPSRAMPTVFDEMDRLFRMMPRPWWPLEESERQELGPAVDMYETDTEVVVKAELPGVKREGIEVSAQQDTLTISATSKQEEEVKEEGYHRKEIRTGTFYRALAMPTPIDEEKVSAKFEDGILTIRATKLADESKSGKKVAIE